LIASRETVPKENAKAISDGNGLSTNQLNNANMESRMEFGRKNFKNFFKGIKAKVIYIFDFSRKSIISKTVL